MATTAVESVIDVAFWFLDKARKEDSYLQPQMLQRLLYLAQGHYAQVYHGRKLMPATFLVFEMGPIEPNIYRMFEVGRPDIRAVMPPPEVENFLERLWLKYGHHGTDYLSEEVRGHEIVWRLLRQGEGQEIPFKLMATFFKELATTKGKTIKTADGRRLQKWIPTAKPIPKKRARGIGEPTDPIKPQEQ